METEKEGAMNMRSKDSDFFKWACRSSLSKTSSTHIDKCKCTNMNIYIKLYAKIDR